jgi:hypothetical protein
MGRAAFPPTAGARAKKWTQSLLWQFVSILVLAAAFAVIVVLYYLLSWSWPAWALLVLCAVAWWLIGRPKSPKIFTRRLARSVIPPARDALGAVSVGLAFVVVELLLLNLLLEYLSSDTIRPPLLRQFEWTVLDVTSTLHALDNLPKPVVLALALLLLFVVHRWPRLKIVARVEWLRSRVHWLSVVMLTATSFSIFSTSPVNQLEAKVHERIVASFNASSARDKSHVGDYLAATSVSRGLSPRNQNDVTYLKSLYNAVAAYPEPKRSDLLDAVMSASQRLARDQSDVQQYQESVRQKLASLGPKLLPTLTIESIPSAREQWHHELQALDAQEDDEEANRINAEETRAAAKTAVSAAVGIAIGDHDGLLGIMVDKVVEWSSAFFVNQIADRWPSWEQQFDSDRSIEAFAALMLPGADVSRQFFFPLTWTGDASQKAESDVAVALKAEAARTQPLIDPALREALQKRANAFGPTDEARPLSKLIEQRANPDANLDEGK